MSLSSYRTHIYLTMVWILSTLCYNLLRGMQEAYVLNDPSLGAQSIPYIKTCIILPTTWLFSLVYVRAQRSMSFKTCYAALQCFFIAVFCVFAAAPYTKNLLYLASSYGVLAPSVWTAIASVTFYSVVELWGSFVFIILFWQIANTVYTTDQAKTMYPFLQIMASAGILIAPALMARVHHHAHAFSHLLMIVVVLQCIAIALIGQLRIPANPLASAKAPTTPKSTSSPPTLCQTIKHPYILCLCVTMCSFEMVVGLFDNIVKAMVSQAFSTDHAYMLYYRYYLISKGLLTLLANVCCYFLLHRVRLSSVFSLTPALCIACCLVFFTYTLHQPWTQISVVSVALSSFAVSLMYAAKYAFFDTSKEIAFIPLSPAMQSQGKSLADGMATKIGRSSSGLLQILVFQCSAYSGYENNMLTFFAITMVVSIVWVIATARVNRMHASLMQNDCQRIN